MGRGDVTLGPAQQVRNPVTEVTFSTMISEVQLDADIREAVRRNVSVRPVF